MTANTTPRERPILFSGPMVRAILDGRKTQTRRVVTRLPEAREGWARHSLRPCLYAGGWSWHDEHGNCHHCDWTVRCPFGGVGDRLWVRETWLDDGTGEPGNIHYRASASDGDLEWLRADGRRWRPSIHMPRIASRLTLEITDVRVERLQDISDGDVSAEGITAEAVQALWDANRGHRGEVTHQGRFPGFEEFSPHDLWCAAWTLINGAASWDADPWAWVVEFRRVGTRAEAA